MGLSVNEFTYAGTDTFDLNFALGYISQNDVSAYTYDPIADPEALVKTALTFDWLTATQVRLQSGHGLAAGDPVVFRRTVSKSSLPVDITQPGKATRENLEVMFLYAVMVMHEVLDARTDDTWSFDIVGDAGLQIIFDYDYLTAYVNARDAA